MAIVIKEIQVKATIEKGQKEPGQLPESIVRQLKNEIIRELKSKEFKRQEMKKER